MCLVSNERRENALDNEANLLGNEDISLIKWVSFLLGHTVCVEISKVYTAQCCVSG